jgi:retron-type reverse transcriptase
VVIKLDYEKAYDKVSIDFLLEVLKLRGFGERWIGWIRKIVIGGSISVLANGEESNTFKTRKGLRQGDPLSPLLFNLAVDVLTKMLGKAARNNLVSRLLEQFRPGGIMTLQYADDTLLLSSCEIREIRNLKCVLMLFEQVCGMRINFNKGVIIPLNLDDDLVHEISHVLNCPVGKLPLKY